MCSSCVCDLDDGVEEADSEDDLPPPAPQDVLLKEAACNLCEGSPHVGTETFGRLVGHLAGGREGGRRIKERDRDRERTSHNIGIHASKANCNELEVRQKLDSHT